MNTNLMVTKRLNLTIPPETQKKLDEICKQEDRTMSNVVKRLIEEAYSKLKKP